MTYFAKPVHGPNANHLLSALTSTQLFGYGNIEIKVEVNGELHTVKSVEVRHDIDGDEVILRTTK